MTRRESQIEGGCVSCGGTTILAVTNRSSLRTVIKSVLQAFAHGQPFIFGSRDIRVVVSVRPRLGVLCDAADFPGSFLPAIGAVLRSSAFCCRAIVYGVRHAGWSVGCLIVDLARSWIAVYGCRSAGDWLAAATAKVSDPERRVFARNARVRGGIANGALSGTRGLLLRQPPERRVLELLVECPVVNGKGGGRRI